MIIAQIFIDVKLTKKHKYDIMGVWGVFYSLRVWYNWEWKGGRVVYGTGLENQRGKPPQVRILSFPPN